MCMYVCMYRCLTNHLPPEDPTWCHEETPTSSTQCCSEDFCNTLQNYKGPIPGESCLNPPHASHSSHPFGSHHHRHILTASHIRMRDDALAPLSVSFSHAHVIAPHHLRFLDRNLWYTHHTHTSFTSYTCIPISLTHTHTHLCPAARHRLFRCVSTHPPTPLPHIFTCASCVEKRRNTKLFLGISHTHTRTRRCTRTAICCCVSSPRPRPRLHSPLCLALSADLSHHSHWLVKNTTRRRTQKPSNCKKEVGKEQQQLSQGGQQTATTTETATATTTAVREGEATQSSCQTPRSLFTSLAFSLGSPLPLPLCRSLAVCLLRVYASRAFIFIHCCRRCPPTTSTLASATTAASFHSFLAAFLCFSCLQYFFSVKYSGGT